MPDPADILPYRAALVVNEYDVEKIVSGKYRRKAVRVAQWGIIDGERAPVSQAEPGEPARLVIEPWADHPELESEQQIDSLPEDFDLPLYAGVTVEPPGEPHPAIIKIIPQEVWLPPGQNFQFKTAVLDQYGNPIECGLRWSTEGGGHISGPYGAGAQFTECRQPGEGTVDATGLFTIGKPGAVTVTVGSESEPAISARAVVGIGSYPAVNPSADLPLRFGLHSWGFHVGWMWGRLGMDMLRGHFNGRLVADCTMPTDGWTYVAAVFDVSGGRRLFVNGKLIGEQRPQPFIIRQ